MSCQIFSLASHKNTRRPLLTLLLCHQPSLSMLELFFCRVCYIRPFHPLPPPTLATACSSKVFKVQVKEDKDMWTCVTCIHQIVKMHGLTHGFQSSGKIILTHIRGWCSGGKLACAGKDSSDVWRVEIFTGGVYAIIFCCFLSMNIFGNVNEWRVWAEQSVSVWQLSPVLWDEAVCLGIKVSKMWVRGGIQIRRDSIDQTELTQSEEQATKKHIGSSL